MKKLFVLILTFLILALFFAACNDITNISVPSADALTKTTDLGVEPILYEDWQSGSASFECEQADCDSLHSYKIEWSGEGCDGAYEYEGNLITISNSNNKTFTWDSVYPVFAVIVKGGKGAHVYSYNGRYADAGLSAPLNPENEKLYDISHVTFCFSNILFAEDFTRNPFAPVSDWKRYPYNSVNWGLNGGNQAGGDAPEMQFRGNVDGTTVEGFSRLISPTIDASGATGLRLTFKHCLDFSPYNVINLWVQVSTDDGVSWDTPSAWSIRPLGNVGPETVTEDLSDYAGESSIRIAWVFLGGDSASIESWSIDDIIVYY
jgi:hypothetical protein